MKLIGLMKSSKGQAGTEAIIALGIILFLFISVYLIYITESGKLLKENDELVEKEGCLELVNVIVNVFNSGEGTETSINVGSNFTVYTNAQRIESEKSFCTIPINQFAHESLSNDSFVLNVGDVRVRNDLGRVMLSNT